MPVFRIRQRVIIHNDTFVEAENIEAVRTFIASLADPTRSSQAEFLENFAESTETSDALPEVDESDHTPTLRLENNRLARCRRAP